ncbi:hypothetical protein [Sphingosinicella sp. BN140058]|nr:hypothetical protein [Sphingosinicella sp. BN140058]
MRLRHAMPIDRCASGADADMRSVVVTMMIISTITTPARGASG